MIIYIKTLTGKTLTLEVEGADKIANVKDKIFKDENILVAQQRLLFKNTELEDQKTLTDYGLYNEATVYLVVRMNAPVVQSQSINVSNVQQNQSLANAKMISLFVLFGDVSLTVNLPSSATVATLKQEILKQKNTNGEMILAFNGKTLTNDKKLEDCQITDGSSVNLTVRLTGGL